MLHMLRMMRVYRCERDSDGETCDGMIPVGLAIIRTSYGNSES